jgi:general secretion pathway protein J
MMPRGSPGFTLLEILVALAVFGFLLVGLSQTVRFGLTAWHQDVRISTGKTDLEAVDRALRLIVENFAPGDDQARPPIEGSPSALTGVTQLRVPGSGLVPVRVEASLALSGRRLVLRWRPQHHWAPVSAPVPPQETSLVGGVSRLAIEYWRPPGSWVSAWREADLPLLIRFRLTFSGPDAPRWPDIIVAPLLSRP